MLAGNCQDMDGPVTKDEIVWNHHHEYELQDPDFMEKNAVLAAIRLCNGGMAVLPDLNKTHGCGPDNQAMITWHLEHYQSSRTK